MPGSSQPDFRNTELDPGLLSTPFNFQTNWHVITGASCSGKTTLIDQLANKGFQIRPEPARQFFESELAKGRTIDEIREDPASFTSQIYALWLELESGLRATEVTFLDRGLPVALAFYRLAGLKPNEILPDCFQHRYASVFLLNRLPYQKDGVRVSDDETAAYLESWTLRDYSAIGYEVIQVPVFLPEERFEFILERIAEQGLR